MANRPHLVSRHKKSSNERTGNLHAALLRGLEDAIELAQVKVHLGLRELLLERLEDVAHALLDLRRRVERKGRRGR